MNQDSGKGWMVLKKRRKYLLHGEIERMDDAMNNSAMTKVRSLHGTLSVWRA